MGEETTPNCGQNHPEELEERADSTHTGLGLVPVLTSQTRKSPNSQETGKSILEGACSSGEYSASD